MVSPCTSTKSNDSSTKYVSASTIRDRSPIRNSAPTVQHNINTSSNEVNFASKEDWIGSLFHGATIKDNVININITNKISNQPPRKRYIIYDDSDEE